MSKNIGVIVNNSENFNKFRSINPPAADEKYIQLTEKNDADGFIFDFVYFLTYPKAGALSRYDEVIGDMLFAPITEDMKRIK